MAWWNPWRPAEQKSSTLDIFREVYGYPSVKSGVSVNWQTALQVTVVLACARVIAEGIAQMPLKLYRFTNSGSEIARDHYLFKMLHRRPNEWQTSFQWRETMLLHAALTGNAFALKVRTAGQVTELLPLAPGSITVKQANDWSRTYEYRSGAAAVMVYPRRDIFHLTGPSWDAVTGLDIVRQAREAIGLAIATEQHGATFFGNGASPSSVITSPGQEPTAEQRAQIRQAFEELHSGVNNHNKTLFLFGGATLASRSTENDKAQFIETRRFQIEEACRPFRVFPMMVQQADKASTFASAEQFFLAHVIHTLGPWVERLEQTIDRDLIEETGDDSLFAKLSTQGLLRGDAQSQAEFFASAITNGWMTRNEVRELRDMNRLDGLDEPLSPLNMRQGKDNQNDGTV